MNIRDKVKFGLAYLQNQVVPNEHSLSRYLRYIVQNNQPEKIDAYFDKVEPKLFKYREYYYSYILMMALKRDNKALIQRYFDQEDETKLKKIIYCRDFHYDLFIAKYRNMIMSSNIQDMASLYNEIKKNELSSYYNNIVKKYTTPEGYKKYHQTYQDYIRNISPKIKIAIVGNGPSIMNLEKGEYIDSFDIIIRINNFKTKGFEKYTGSKTDIWVTGRAEIEAQPDINAIIITPSSWYFRKRKGYSYINSLFTEQKQGENKHSFFLPYDEMVKNEFFALMLNPSTGIRAITWALSITDQPVHIFGFDFYLSKSHYYYKSGDIDLHWKDPHDFEWEKKFIEVEILNNRIIKE